MLRYLAALLLMLAALPAAAQDGSGFTIGGIEVDAAGKSAIEAREAGWQAAQRKAWPVLWSRLTGAPAANAPRLGDGALNSMVSGIEVEREFIGPQRYVGRLAIVFDRSRAAGYLGATARMLRSAPMLLMPVEIDGGVRSVYERRGPWTEAWARLRSDTTPMDYIRAPGTQGDAMTLSAWQAYRPSRELWRAALGRYGAANVVQPEAQITRAYPGGPVTGRFRALAGPDAREFARFELRAASTAELPQMLDAAVRRMDLAYTEALRAGELRAEEDLLVELTPVIASGAPYLGYVPPPAASIVVDVASPTPETLRGFEVALLATPGVTDVAPVGIAYGGDSRLRVNYTGRLEDLRYSLDLAGYRLDVSGGGYRLRPRLADEPPLPPPALPASDVALLGGAESGADTPVLEDAVIESDAPGAGAPPAGAPVPQEPPPPPAVVAPAPPRTEPESGEPTG